jgi:hypothetical protein
MRRPRRVAVSLLLLAALACAKQSAEPRADEPDAQAPMPPAAARLPARLRRLSNTELTTTVAALLPGAPAWPGELAPDARQSNFSANAGQRVDPLWAAQLAEGIHGLVSGAAPALVAGLGCGAGEGCAGRFIDDFVARAWRRPLDPGEKAELLEVFRAGASEAGFTDGIALVAEAALQAASFLYLDELGETPAAPVRLGPYQVASALAYLATGGPPDAALLAVAREGGLASPGGRETQVRRLLATDGGKRQVQRFVAEWLGLDRLTSLRKDNDLYPAFEPMRPYLAAETDAFVAEVVFHDAGTLERLLTADFTMAAPPLADFYHLTANGEGRVALGSGPRRGILTQGSFLAVYGHQDGSAPIKRGVAVLDRLLCLALPPPADRALTMTVPPPAPGLTTRARFEAHTRDPSCAGCHALIDPVGFAFEGFDGMGGARTEENGQPIVTGAQLQVEALAGPVDGAAELTARLAASPEVATCFARNFFRFAAAQADEALEAEYLRSVWSALPAQRRTNVVDLFASWAASELFVVREAAP